MFMSALSMSMLLSVCLIFLFPYDHLQQCGSIIQLIVILTLGEMEVMPWSMPWILDCHILNDARPTRSGVLIGLKSNTHSGISHGPHDSTNPTSTRWTQTLRFLCKTSHAPHSSTHQMRSHQSPWQWGYDNVHKGCACASMEYTCPNLPSPLLKITGVTPEQLQKVSKSITLAGGGGYFVAFESRALFQNAYASMWCTGGWGKNYQ